MQHKTVQLKQRLGLTGEPVFLMDGSAFIFRSFYASRQMQRSDGFPTNALVIVGRILLNVLKNENPRYFAFFKDGKGKNFRHDLYADYKANRQAMPEDLVRQLAPIRQMVEALGIKFIESSKCEADDCIASLARKFSVRHPVVIISADKDLKQCLRDNVFLWDPGSRDERLISRADFVSEEGVTPEQWPDFQALVGDTSDNIPGIPGIGPKTARQIFRVGSSLEEIGEKLGEMAPKIRDKLRPGLEKSFLWRELARLRTDQCQSWTLDDLKVRPIDRAACINLAREYELTAFHRDLDKYILSQSRIKASATGYSLLGMTKNNPASGASQSLTADGLDDPKKDCGNETAYSILPGISARKICRAADLPDCATCRVAAIQAEPGAGFISIALAPGNTAGDLAGNIEEFDWHGNNADLCNWLENTRGIVVYDLKSLLDTHESWRNLCSKTGIGHFFDLSIAAYMKNTESGDYSLPKILHAWTPPDLSAKVGLGGLCLYISHMLEKRLADELLLALYKNLELPLIPILSAMELRGIRIDAQAFEQFLLEVQSKLEDLSRKIYEEAGEKFNLRSSQQLAQVLYHRLGLPSSSRTGGGKESTSLQALEKLSARHPVIDHILKYRKLEKIRSTYLCPLPGYMDKSGRIHTTFNQKGTATGRLSSSNPNLQNIPVRGELGKRMRECFIAGENNLLVSADYSQIELRVLAHYSNDQALLEAFRDGEDIHARTAALIFDDEPANILPDQRRAAKTINFGLVYGMGAQKLARELKISTQEAKNFIDRYFQRLSGLRNFYDSVEENVRAYGYVTTLGGRKRLLPNIMSTNGQTFALARRQAINTMIQGSAADIIKLAMLAVENDPLLKDLDARMLLQIHDELLLESPAENASTVAERVAMLMSQVRPGGVEIQVPLLVEWGIGKNWGIAH